MQLTGDTKQQPNNDDEHILGNNPGSSVLNSYLPHNTLRSIASWGSRGNQFVADNSPQHIAGACPYWASDNPPASCPGGGGFCPGVGVMQITPNTGPDIWNWVTNANEGVAKFAGLSENNPGFYASAISVTPLFNSIVQNMIANLAQQKITLTDVIIPDFTSGDFDSNLLRTQCEVIRGYNGYAGHDMFNLHLHEYQVVMDTSQSCQAFLLTINPQTHIGSTQWSRVPASQRPATIIM